MDVLTQEERLQKEILAEAQTRADRIVARANSAAKAAKERAEKENAAQRERALTASRKEADQKTRNIIQGIWMEERKMWLRKREECLQAFFASILKEAQDTVDERDREKSLSKLAKEAMVAIEADEIRVFVAEADTTLVTPAWLEAIAGHPLKATIEVDKAIRGGIRIATLDGTRVYDNSYAGRLRRLDQEFRQELSSCDK